MLPIVIIVGYLVGVTALGSVFARRAATGSGWAVASGRLGLLMVAAGVAGTRIGGVGTYGVAGDVMSDGLWTLWYGVNTFLALGLVGVFFAVPFRRLGLQTVSEAFTQRFGARRCQVLASLCVQTEFLIVNILEPFLIASIVSAVIDVPFWVGVVIGVVTLITYTSLGGLWGSAATNLIHCAVIIVGLSAVVVAGAEHLGGWAVVADKVDRAVDAAGTDRASWWSFVGAGWGAVLAMFFSATVHTPAVSVYANFASAARRERDVMPAFLLAGAVASTMPVLAGLVGLLTLAHYGVAAEGVTSYRAITQLALEIHPVVGGVALAAILAAVISSGGPILLASSTMLVRDWMPARWFPDEAAQGRGLRITTVAYGVFGGVIALFADIRSILDLVLFAFAMVVPPAVSLGYVLYWPRATERGCYWGMLVGYAGGLVWFLTIRWAEWAGFEAGEGVVSRVAYWCFGDGGVDPSYITTLIPLLAVPLLSLWRPDGDGAARDAFYQRLRVAR